MTTIERIKTLIAAFSSPSIDKRHESVKKVATYGERAVAPLIEALEDATYPDLQWYIATALARIGKPGIGPLLAAMNKNSDPGVQEIRRCSAGSDWSSW